MPRRIDLGDSDSGELEEAMRQLERQQRAAGRKRAEPTQAAGEPAAQARRRMEEQRAAEHRRVRQDIAEDLAQIREEIRVARAPRRGARRARRIALVVLLVLAAGLVAGILLALRPTPLPPAAQTPQAAVRGYWEAVIDGNYEAATVYYPDLVARYSSRKQAAYRLEQEYRDNPPRRIVSIGEPEAIPDTETYRVRYELTLSTGRPLVGDAVVGYDPGQGETEPGWVILQGP